MKGFEMLCFVAIALSLQYKEVINNINYLCHSETLYQLQTKSETGHQDKLTL